MTPHITVHGLDLGGDFREHCGPRGFPFFEAGRTDDRAVIRSLSPKNRKNVVAGWFPWSV